MSNLKETLQQHVVEYQEAYQRTAEARRIQEEGNIQRAVDLRLDGIEDKLIEAAKVGHRYYVVEKEAQIRDTAMLDWQNPRISINPDLLTGVSKGVYKRLQDMGLDLELWIIRNEDYDNVYRHVQMRVVW